MNENEILDNCENKSVEVQPDYNVINEANTLVPAPNNSTEKKKKEKGRWPWYVTLFSVFLAITITYFGTFTFVKDYYETYINQKLAKNSSETELDNAISLVQQLDDLFTSSYYYDVDYDTMAQ